MLSHCPLCGSLLKNVHRELMDSLFGPVCEEIDRCPNNCYSEEFAYGSRRIDFTFTLTNPSPATLARAIRAAKPLHRIICVPGPSWFVRFVRAVRRIAGVSTVAPKGIIKDGIDEVATLGDETPFFPWLTHDWLERNKVSGPEKSDVSCPDGGP